ncbi:MAG: hypothetical protein LBS35_05535 [Synergistaceae bacterium]|jgi:hypothetical protein|nr:hypothetical protein [Synergistaceae bacterium]
MERIRAFGLLKKFVSVVLVAAALIGAASPPPAEAFIEEIIAEIVIVASWAALNYGILPEIVKAAESAYEAAAKTYLYEALYIDQQRNQWNLEKDLYDLDHEALGSSSVVYGNLAPFLTALAGTSPRSDSGSWAQMWNAAAFRGANPGYRNVSAGSAGLIFSGVYDDRVKRLTEDYTARFIESNAETARDILAVESPTNILAARDLTNVMHRTAGLENGGYRRTSQAAAQIQTSNNQQVSRLRAETMAQTDAYAVFALNEIQERTDSTAAFDQAVKIWKPIPAGARY